VDLFSRAAAKVRTTQPRASLENPLIPISSSSLVQLLGGEAPSSAGKSVTPRTALGIPAVWRAVNLISTTCAGLPLGTYRNGPDDVRVKVTTGAAAALIDQPHPDMIPLVLWELVYGSICLYGNGYLRKLRNQLGTITELWWVNPARVKCGRLGDAGSGGYVPVGRHLGDKYYLLDGGTDGEHIVYDDTMLHIPGWGYDGVCGVSPIRAAREGLGLALAAEEFGARLFGSGSLATGLLQTDQRVEKADADRLKELWRQGGTGLGSAHDIRVIGSGAKFTQLTIPPEDAQFLETRAFQIEEVARMFGIPPHLLMAVDKQTSWGSGIEQQNLALITYSLQGYLQRVEQSLTKVLRPQALYVRYTLEGLLRGDSAQRAEFYTKMWQLGALSTNDIRRLEDLEPVEGGDVRYRPLNFGVLGEQTPNPALPATADDAENADQEDQVPADA
jgi:HK97 family phage portal protein